MTNGLKQTARLTGRHCFAELFRISKHCFCAKRSHPRTQHSGPTGLGILTGLVAVQKYPYSSQPQVDLAHWSVFNADEDPNVSGGQR